MAAEGRGSDGRLARGERESRPAEPVPLPVLPREGPEGLDAESWFALMALGIVLFVGGVYLGLAVAGAVPSALPRYGWFEALPFVLTISGGVLGSYAYEEWYQRAEGPGGKGRRIRNLKDIPSFEIVPPERRRER
ncbi:MAG: hypothetical protein ACRECR_01845 [Thermoplasmata archaeon]